MPLVPFCRMSNLASLCLLVLTHPWCICISVLPSSSNLNRTFWVCLISIHHSFCPTYCYCIFGSFFFSSHSFAVFNSAWFLPSFSSSFLLCSFCMAQVRKGGNARLRRLLQEAQDTHPGRRPFRRGVELRASKHGGS